MAILQDFYIKQGDTAEPIVITAEYDDGTPVTESFVGATAKFHMKSAAGTLLIANGSATIVDAATRKLGYQWVTGDTSVASPSPSQPHEAEFQVTLSDARIMTFPNTTNIYVHVFPEIA